MERTNLLGLRPDDLMAWLADRGVAARPEHCRRVIASLIARGEAEPGSKRPIPKRVLDRVHAEGSWSRLAIEERVEDPDDGFVKYLLRHPDGALTEAVRIPLKKAGCFTVCLSSQVGCAMGCVFCATGRLGLKRNLEAWEIVATFLAVRDDTPGRITGAVFQGQGEPLHNYDAVIQAARVLSDPCGGQIKAEAITNSTVGLVPQIRRFAQEGHNFRLIVSLTSAVAERRTELLPVAGRFGLGELREAMSAAAANEGGLFTVAWVMMDGVNTGADEIAALKELLAGLPVRINLIDVNDARPDGFRAPDDAGRGKFVDGLQVLGAPIVRRYSGGSRRHAACGMLASTRWEDAPS